tara:strand:- start:721 stop:846 length:126 start_codon:yes stop_codon:yes gene_type:complete
MATTEISDITSELITNALKYDVAKKFLNIGICIYYIIRKLN